MGLIPRVLAARAHAHFYGFCFTWLGVLKKYADFIILIFSILDISKGHQENLRKQEECRPGEGPSFSDRGDEDTGVSRRVSC